MSDLNDFDRWLIGLGYDLAEVDHLFPQLWAQYEAWCQAPSFEVLMENLPEAVGGESGSANLRYPVESNLRANLPECSTVLLLTDERWPARAIRTEVVL